MTGHFALARRPLILALSKQGIGIRTSDHNRFIAWHHLDRVFVAGNVLAIAFKRDYPEVEKPRGSATPLPTAASRWLTSGISRTPGRRSCTPSPISRAPPCTGSPHPVPTKIGFPGSRTAAWPGGTASAGAPTD
ncbi:hypothetical protein NKG94_05890 [Micromonospora sp. M12]